MRSQLLVFATFFGLVAANVAYALPACPAPPAKRGDCIHDGDTWWDRGVKYRHATIDTPEIGEGARCSHEVELGIRARDRLVALTASGFTTEPTGGVGKYGRVLATLRLRDGREAGAVLVAEGLASIYGQGKRDWCR